MKPIVLALILTVCVGPAFAAPSAEELYGQGESAYNSGDYATAIAKWKRSYKLSRATLLLFNLANAYRRSGECAKALTNYKRFVEVDPDTTSEHHTHSDEFIRELEPQCGTGGEVPAIDGPEQPPKRGGTAKLAGLVVGGAGIVSIAIGLGFGYHASTLSDEVERACTTADPCDWSTVKSKDASGHLQTKVGWTLGALGAAAAVGGAALYYFGGRDEGVAVAPLTRSRETGAMITWRTRW